jgi:hypothetical protein
MAKVLRILSGAALLVVVVAGCGGAVPQGTASQRLPRALAQDWEAQASAIATAADAGNDCRAMRLAASLRTEVRASRHKLPLRLRSPLLTDVNDLADRISTCTRIVTVPVQPTPTKGPKPKPPPHEPPDHKGHDKHGHGDDK